MIIMGKNNTNKFVDIVLPTEAADSYYMNKNKHYILKLPTLQTS